MSGLLETGRQALSQLGKVSSLRKTSTILVFLVALSVSLAVLFSFTQTNRYFSVIPSGYRSKSASASDPASTSDSSHASDTYDVSENSKSSTNSNALKSSIASESFLAQEATAVALGPDTTENSGAPASHSTLATTPPRKQWEVEGWPVPEVPAPSPRHDRRFVVILTATSPSPDLCKTVFSALALGYPAPIIVGWGMDYRAISKWESGPNLLKIPAVLEYLESALHDGAHPSEKLEHDDIVMVADGYDVWFQLPPEVLLKRYHDINEKANARLREQWHGKGPMPMKQTIVAGSEKNCWPRPWINSNSNIQCPNLPDSPIREDLYGPETDKNQTVRHDLRPRYINGGIYIGPAADIRRWFRRSMHQMVDTVNGGGKIRSEQGITGQIFGEQEVWRQWMRENDGPMSEAMTLIQRDFEYHIGLDYFQVINVQTQNAGDDGRIIKLNNQTKISQRSAALGIDPVRLQGVPEDVRSAKNPLSGLVANPDWGKMPLYADFFTESVPIILHHNGKGPGQKERRQTWWHRPWFFKYLRLLVERHLAPAEPTVLAKVETENGTVKYRALDAESLGRRPRMMKDSITERLTEAKFDQICGAPNEAWWNEVFRDGKEGLD